MKAVGIVAEYNPFHTGHAFHMAETRRLLGTDRPIVCVMSGNWVQRGECALTDKWTRAGLALQGGADLVLELPLPWAISSAEGFAQGAVETLKATGVVDTLSFGSESGQLNDLAAIAQGLEGEDYQKSLRAKLDKGISFADARQKAALQTVGAQAELLRGANDNLGVEYLRAAGKDLSAIAVLRQGVPHDSDSPANGFASASYLRQMAIIGNWPEVERWTERGTVEALQKAGIAKMGHIERALLSRLRQMGEEDFALLPDSGAAAGLPARLVRAAEGAESLEGFYAQAKSKSCTHARIRRLALWAFLGLTAADRPKSPLYLRVLSFNDRGQALLREMKEAACLPVLTKSAHIKELSLEAQALFSLEARSTDLFGLCFDKIRPCGMEYTTGPVMVH